MSPLLPRVNTEEVGEPFHIVLPVAWGTVVFKVKYFVLPRASL